MGAWGAHRRCRQARDSSGLAGCQALGLAQTIAAPTCGSPGLGDPPSSRSAHAAAHPRLRQGNTCARRSRAPGPGEGGGPPAAAAWQLGSSPPTSKSQKWGLFPSLQLHQAVQSSVHRARGGRAPPRAREVGAAQPDPAEPCWVPAATTTLSPPSPRGWERLWGAGRAFWGASLGGAQGWGMPSETLSDVSCFPWLGASHRWEGTEGHRPVAPVVPELLSLPAGRHRAAGPPRTHPAALGHHTGPP